MLGLPRVRSITLPFSEVCMHLRAAGTEWFAVVDRFAVQLVNNDGSPFSFPITTGEAGIALDLTT